MCPTCAVSCAAGHLSLVYEEGEHETDVSLGKGEGSSGEGMSSRAVCIGEGGRDKGWGDRRVALVYASVSHY